MTLLGLDTATAVCAVGAMSADGSVHEIATDPQRLHSRPAHTRELLPAIAQVLERAGGGFDSVEGVVVGVGPGAFTGLRIGVATARAIAAAARVPLTPVSSLAALALGAARDDPLCAVLAINDARRSELYWGARRGDGTTIAADQVCPVVELTTRIRELALEGPVMAVGDAVESLRDQLTAIGVTVPASDDVRHMVAARSLFELAAYAVPVPVDDVVPNYIRPPDAKRSSRASWVAAITGPSGGER